MKKSFIRILLYTLILIAVAMPFVYPINSTDISSYIPSIHAKIAFIEQRNVYLYQFSKIASIGLLYLAVAIQFVIVLPLMFIGKYVPYYLPIIGLAIILMVSTKQFVKSNGLFSKGLLSKLVGLFVIMEVLAISIIIPINFEKMSEMINLFI